MATSSHLMSGLISDAKEANWWPHTRSVKGRIDKMLRACHVRCARKIRSRIIYGIERQTSWMLKPSPLSVSDFIDEFRKWIDMKWIGNHNRSPHRVNPKQAAYCRNDLAVFVEWKKYKLNYLLSYIVICWAWNWLDEARWMSFDKTCMYIHKYMYIWKPLWSRKSVK